MAASAISGYLGLAPAFGWSLVPARLRKYPLAMSRAARGMRCCSMASGASWLASRISLAISADDFFLKLGPGA